MDDLERKYRTLVERISGYPMSEAARTRILAEVEEAYRRERVSVVHGVTMVRLLAVCMPANRHAVVLPRCIGGEEAPAFRLAAMSRGDLLTRYSQTTRRTMSISVSAITSALEPTSSTAGRQP